MAAVKFFDKRFEWDVVVAVNFFDKNYFDAYSGHLSVLKILFSKILYSLYTILYTLLAALDVLFLALLTFWSNID